MAKAELIQVQVACAESGPYVDEARAFLEASDRLSTGRSEAHGFKCQLVLSCFHLRERLEASPENPVPRFRDALPRYAAAMHAFTDLMTGTELPFSSCDRREDEAALTADHYGALFSEFDAFHYSEEPLSLLRPRLERNGFLTKPLEGVALDAGCGNGRYTLALRTLGFPEAIGVDFSPLNIDVARQRCQEAGVREVEYRLGNVLDLPLPEASCSFVLSNGVLHHTGQIFEGLCEIARVLRPGGLAYLKLMPNPGGMFWDAIELSRYVMQDVPCDFARRFLALAGVPANRRYYLLDHLMVPINERLTASACEALIARAGFTAFERCRRGADIDRLEQIYQQAPFCHEKYGDGVNLYRAIR